MENFYDNMYMNNISLEKKFMKKYMSRIVDKELEFRLKSKGTVWVRGPKYCGKSTTSARNAKTIIYMQDEETREQNTSLAKLSPSLFLKGDTPLLIDEWQVIPFIWNQIRFEIDKRDSFGQFILTGSRMPDNKNLNKDILHSGTGRIVNLLMRPMSLYESCESTGAVSIEDLFNNKEFVSSKCDKDINDYAYFTARGGWPIAIGESKEIALQQAIDYYDSLISKDISEVDGIKRNKDKADVLLKSLSRNCATPATLATIKKDIISHDFSSLDEGTLDSYINALKNLFIIENSVAWNPNLRSKTAIRTRETRYFIDPSIACAALGIGPEGLLGDIKTFGLLFENLCIRDLRIYAQSIGGEVKHYRDANDLECDAVITLRDGSWAAIEIKLGIQELIEEGANNLLSLADKMDDNFKKPSFLMILTTVNAAYKREDGVFVVPLATLKN